MKVKVTITRVIDDDRETYWGLEDWFADGLDSTDFIEFAQDEAVDEILDGATWKAEIISKGWLDQPTEPGWYAWFDYRRRGVSQVFDDMTTDDEPGGLLASYFELRKWYRLDIAWPEESES